MKQARLNDELTILGLIFILVFVLYEFSINLSSTLYYKDQLFRAYNIMMQLDKSNDSKEARIKALTAEVERLKQEIKTDAELEKIKKDIARAWDK